MSRVTLALFCLGATVAPSAQVRDTPPPHIEAARRETELKSEIAARGLTPERAAHLAYYQHERGAGADAERTLLDARKQFPNDADLLMTVAVFYTRDGKSPQALAALEDLRRLRPDDPAVHQLAATYYEEMARKGAALREDVRREHISNGIAAVDRALALDPQYMEALVYRNILLRHQAGVETDPARQKALTDEANLLRARAIQMQKEARSGRFKNAPPRILFPPRGEVAFVAAPPPPPASPGSRAGCEPGAVFDGPAPVRVGGNIKAPTRVHHVGPMYPQRAKEARIQGVVILEATVAADGTVRSACVLRGIPELDEAAVEAVRQWQFTPTLLNGVPVPVIMTVTVNFTLQ